MTTPAKVRIVGIVAACLILTISGVWNSDSNPAKVHADQVKDAG